MSLSRQVLHLSDLHNQLLVPVLNNNNSLTRVVSAAYVSLSSVGVQVLSVCVLHIPDSGRCPYVRTVGLFPFDLINKNTHTHKHTTYITLIECHEPGFEVKMFHVVVTVS